MKEIEELRLGLETAYIDGNVASNLMYKPQFVSNNYKEGKKVLSSIEDELLMCDQFQISVAFITLGGIEPLLQTLKELEKKHIPGEILTTNYLNFSEPKALEKLNQLQNITLKMYDVEVAEEGFHTKGYIFKKEEIYRIIIGSSNMTRSALTTNREWNTKVVSTEQGEVAQEIVEEFEELWNSEHALTFSEFYENYKQKYEIIKRQREIAKKDPVTSIEKYKLQPNRMQVGFISNLRQIIERMPEKQLDKVLTGLDMDKGYLLQNMKLIPEMYLRQIIESITGEEAQGSSNDLRNQLAQMGDLDYKQAILNLEPDQKRQLTLLIASGDEKYFNNFDADAYTHIINRECQKYDVVNAMGVIKTEYLEKMIMQLPPDLLSIVITQVDTEKFADALINKFPETLARFVAA